MCSLKIPVQVVFYLLFCFVGAFFVDTMTDPVLRWVDDKKNSKGVLDCLSHLKYLCTPLSRKRNGTMF
jgi:hypothetical protein